LGTKNVLVTGGSRGIGEKIVRVLAASGYSVQFTYCTSKNHARKLVDELASEWSNQVFTASYVDLANRNDIQELSSQISQADELYSLVHNAGMTYDALAAAINQDHAERMMQVNFWSMTQLVAAAIRPMMRARSGRIITIGSIAASYGSSGNASYAASKGAMLGYVKSLSVELARKGVAVNYIAPGYVDTDMLSPYAKDRVSIEKQIPMRRFADPAEVAGLVRFLLEPEAAYITGSVIPIDGGLSAFAPINRK